MAKLFFRERKRSYRSVRGRPSYGPGTVLLSLIVWLALAGGVLYAVDKAGLLERALDAGVGAAQNAGDTPDTPEPNPVTEPAPLPPTSGSATGDLTAGGQGPATLPAASTSPAGTAAAPAVEIEQWLVILHTIPKSSRDEAERRRSQYHAKGLAVDILDTDAFHRLKKGSWIIALGPFENRAEALLAADKAKELAPGLMIRRGL
ncbi:MAG: SPOR domain-containing protein [Candidatus Adiutrix sp.]|nr:SPOR domain-containing protein [Candidatus Adiutrix sp.]